MQNNLHTKAISIKLTQANVPKKYADEARQVCVIRFYPTIRILTGTLREIPTKVNFILSSMQNNLHTKAISIKLTQAKVPKKLWWRSKASLCDQILPYYKNPHRNTQRDSHKSQFHPVVNAE